MTPRDPVGGRVLPATEDRVGIILSIEYFSSSATDPSVLCDNWDGGVDKLEGIDDEDE